MLIKYEPNKVIKEEDNLDNFYLHLQKIEVHYDEVAYRLFPFTIDGRSIAWYHNIPTNSIQNWRGV